MHLINASIFKFVDHYIGNEEVRKQLYTRWTAFRRIKSGRKHLQQLIKQTKTPVHLVYGKHDRIILPGGGKKLQKGIEEYCSLDMIASGHQVLHGKHAMDILKHLMGNKLD
jgi:pimeloyl-ACP methyl ester carboxylesterase